jgi:hypothetical protein
MVGSDHATGLSWTTESEMNFFDYYRPPTSLSSPAGPGDAWKVTDPAAITGSQAETLRISGARAESSLRALGIVFYAFGAYWGVAAMSYLTIFYLNATGRILAPWITESFCYFMIICLTTMGALAISTGFGLRRLRVWSPRTGIVLASVYAVYWCVLWGRALSKGDTRDAVLTFVVGTIFLFPMLSLLGSGNGLVFSPEYEAAVGQTPYIKVRAKLPAAIKWSMGSVVALTIALALALNIR